MCVCVCVCVWVWVGVRACPGSARYTHIMTRCRWHIVFACTWRRKRQNRLKQSSSLSIYSLDQLYGLEPFRVSLLWISGSILKGPSSFFEAFIFEKEIPHFKDVSFLTYVLFEWFLMICQNPSPFLQRHIIMKRYIMNTRWSLLLPINVYNVTFVV